MRTRRQRLGQHFLRDERVARDIAAALPPGPRVLEVGPGQGALTRQLLERFPLVRAVELDHVLAASLARNLREPPGLEVRHGDALGDDLDDLGSEGPWLVAGNLPYSVGTAIIRRLLRRGDLFPWAVVMVQEEVAQRLAAGPTAGSRGLLSLEAELFGEPELLFSVAPRCFVPPPRVRSAVVRVRIRAEEEIPPSAARALEIAAVAFAHRRKKLRNALASERLSGRISEVLASVGVSPDLRPQDLSAREWLGLAAALPACPGAPA